jgi:hypothetical protein
MVRDIAERARRPFIGQLLADGGPDAVGADQCRALIVAAVRDIDPHAIAQILERLDRCIGDHLHIGQRAARIQEHLMQVDAMDHDIGLAEALKKGLAGRNAGYHAAVDPVIHHQRLRPQRFRQHCVGYAQPVEHPEHVGAELDAEADDTEFLCLLQHQNIEALASERQRRHGAAQSGTDDDDGKLTHARLRSA